MRALQGLAPDHVALVGTVSKTLAPALRLGWLILPPGLLDDVTRHKRLADTFSPTLEQLTLAAFLRSGDFYRHVRKARAVYRTRRDRLLEALAEQLPELEVGGTAAGVHLLLRLPVGVDAYQLLSARGRNGSRSRHCRPSTSSKVDPAAW